MAAAATITIPDGVLPATVLPAPAIDGAVTPITLQRGSAADFMDHEVELQINGQQWFYDTNAQMLNPVKLGDGQTVKVVVPGGAVRLVYIKGATGAGNLVPMVNR